MPTSWPCRGHCRRRRCVTGACTSATSSSGRRRADRSSRPDDEEILVLFASQAANAIANARAHRDERRARADLEALVETSPVGVVVFDAGTGRPASLNREARRLVDGLNAPGRPPEELLGALTCRFSDGREIALAELPMKQVISDAATVRADDLAIQTARLWPRPGPARPGRQLAQSRARPHAPSSSPGRWSAPPGVGAGLRHGRRRPVRLRRHRRVQQLPAGGDN